MYCLHINKWLYVFGCCLFAYSPDDPGDHSIEEELLTVIWAMGQTPSQFSHSPGSSLEREEASNTEFYQEDEIKYHGSLTRGSTQINFFSELGPTCLPLRHSLCVLYTLCGC